MRFKWFIKIAELHVLPSEVPDGNSVLVLVAIGRTVVGDLDNEIALNCGAQAKAEQFLR